jgi:hypothetical protein
MPNLLVRPPVAVRSLSLFLLFGLAGCEQFYQVDEACFETLAGAGSLPPTSAAALARVNCYRNLTGVAKFTANDQVQIAADGQVNYVLANPDADKLISSIGAVSWLSQTQGAPSYTGVEVYERLTGAGAGQAGYVFFDPINTNIWEYIHIEAADTQEALPSGAAAVDHLMRDPVFRQVALQPSWIDGAYAELDLPPPWLQQTGDTTTVGTALTTASQWARVYYMVVVYTAPHLEHVDRPVILPKQDQVGVPLYAWSENQDIPLDNGVKAPVQISYPITLLMGALDPANYSEVDTNQYQASFTAAAIQAEDGTFLRVEPVIPGDEEEGVFPEGRLLRTTLALYADLPFEPATSYTLFAEYTSPEGNFQLDYTFRTASEDPGLDTDVGRTGETQDPSPTARSWPVSHGFLDSAPRRP